MASFSLFYLTPGNLNCEVRLFFFGDWLQEGTTFTRPTPGLAYNYKSDTHQNSLSGLVTLLALVRFGFIFSSRRGSRLRDLRGKVRLARSQPPCFTRVIYRLLSVTLSTSNFQAAGAFNDGLHQLHGWSPPRFALTPPRLFFSLSTFALLGDYLCDFGWPLRLTIPGS